VAESPHRGKIEERTCPNRATCGRFRKGVCYGLAFPGIGRRRDEASAQGLSETITRCVLRRERNGVFRKPAELDRPEFHQAALGRNREQSV